ncbi:hypothetical protein [Burkholderia ubonensis]|uniref:hypothetical protein n=1 Tax=Burkholderia ubonensis TaxID=101571 RepID=UPI001E4AC0B9|nr:hypothetical protein [Burkholderia ubonensis]
MAFAITLRPVLPVSTNATFFGSSAWASVAHWMQIQQSRASVLIFFHDGFRQSGLMCRRVWRKNHRVDLARWCRIAARCDGVLHNLDQTTERAFNVPTRKLLAT